MNFASAHEDYLDPDRHLNFDDEEGSHDEEPEPPHCPVCDVWMNHEDAESDIGKPARWYCPVCENEE